MLVHHSIRRRHQTLVAGAAEALRQPEQLPATPYPTGKVFPERRLDTVAEREPPRRQLQCVSTKQTPCLRQHTDQFAAHAALNHVALQSSEEKPERHHNHQQGVHQSFEFHCERGEPAEEHTHPNIIPKPELPDAVVRSPQVARRPARPDIPAAGHKPSRCASGENVATIQVARGHKMAAHAHTCQPERRRIAHERHEHGWGGQAHHRIGSSDIGREAVPHLTGRLQSDVLPEEEPRVEAAKGRGGEIEATGTGGVRRQFIAEARDTAQTEGGDRHEQLRVHCGQSGDGDSYLKRNDFNIDVDVVNGECCGCGCDRLNA